MESELIFTELHRLLLPKMVCDANPLVTPEILRYTAPDTSLLQIANTDPSKLLETDVNLVLTLVFGMDCSVHVLPAPSLETHTLVSEAVMNFWHEISHATNDNWFPNVNVPTPVHETPVLVEIATAGVVLAT